MPRLLLVLAGLALAACASAPRPPQGSRSAGAPGAPIAVPGFEKQPNEIVTEYGLARDGKPDLWVYVLKDEKGKERLLRKERDLDGDGKVDTWERYGPDGTVVQVVHDLDFDGRPDVTLFYEKGQLVKKELAFGFDGVPRAWAYYEQGKLVRKERDTNSDGKVDTWEYWVNGELDRVGIDENGDGRIDRWESRKSDAAPGGQK